MEPVRFRLWWLTRQQVKEIYDATFEEKIMLPPALEHEIYEAFDAEDEDYQEGKYFIPACCRIELEQIEMDTPPDDDANGIGIVYPVEWEAELYGLTGLRRNLVVTGELVPFVNKDAMYAVMHVDFAELQSISAVLLDRSIGVTEAFRKKIHSLASMTDAEFHRMQNFCSAVEGTEPDHFRLALVPEKGTMGIVCLLSDFNSLPFRVREKIDYYPAFYTGKPVELESDEDYPVPAVRETVGNKGLQTGFHCIILNKKDVDYLFGAQQRGDFVIDGDIETALCDASNDFQPGEIFSAVPTYEPEFFEIPDFKPGKKQIAIVFANTQFSLDLGKAGVIVEAKCIKRPVPTLTEDEVRELFLQHVRNVVGYWTGVYDRGERTPAECISGCAFSILVMLDGGSADLPGWAVVPYPHEEDKAFLIAQGIKPYPELSNELHRQLVDIAGSLHELFHNPNVPVVRNPLHITKKDWQESRATKRWAFTVEVLLKEGEEFERVRKEGNPVAFLVDEYEVLTKRAEELGVHYVPLDYDTMSPDFSFKFATDDDQIFAKMIKTLDAYVIRGYF